MLPVKLNQFLWVLKKLQNVVKEKFTLSIHNVGVGPPLTYD